MIRDFSILSHTHLRAGTPCYTPSGWAPLAHDEDPAVKAMTDFKQVTPVTIEPYSTITAALEKMKKAGVRLLLIPDQEDNIIGIITAADIQGERPIKLIQEQGITHDDIHVEMIMTPLDQVMALDMVTVRNARVGHIINTLRKLELQHTLVVELDPATHRHTIRGLFSTSHISKLIGQDITDPEYAAHSLAEIQHELDNSKGDRIMYLD